MFALTRLLLNGFNYLSFTSSLPRLELMFPAMSGQQHTRHSLDLPLDEDVGGITERSGHPRLGLILEQRRVIEP